MPAGTGAAALAAGAALPQEHPGASKALSGRIIDESAAAAAALATGGSSMAAAAGEAECVRLLKAANANVDARDAAGQTPVSCVLLPGDHFLPKFAQKDSWGGASPGHPGHNGCFA